MKEIVRLCVVLVSIGAICAAVMAFVDQETKAPIEKSAAAEKMDAVKAVMPPLDNNLEKDAVTIKDADPSARRSSSSPRTGTRGTSRFSSVSTRRESSRGSRSSGTRRPRASGARLRRPRSRVSSSARASRIRPSGAS